MPAHFCVLPTEAIQSLSTCDGPISYARLPHPRTGVPALFLPAENGEDAGKDSSRILELQAVNPVDSRSWFLENEVIADGKLVLMTPIDPVFLLLPILFCIQPTDGSVPQFKPADDMLEEAALAIQQQYQSRKDGQVLSRDVLQFTRLRCARNALKFICDVKEITEEITVYRYSQERTLEYLRKKAVHLSNPKIIEISKTIVRSLAKDGLMEDGNEELLKSGQLRAACDLLAQYLSPAMRDSLYASYDFTKLDVFLKNAAAETMASIAAIPVNGGKVKTSAKVATEGKKRKAAKGSHGVETLKKANVNGMAKLSTFFKKTEKAPS
ncbi:hypothetical protein P691DRAFT_798942 [Macrolepiota fuliginosa MF-IS2]|uniref:Ribonuclease H2 subunit B n=1 Tax=Macrolepiota fuliginosa MF-IS2 TaxID=1400762 RepID=A0A9P6CAE3_9AGAR|nr:hypothetical protein P691DRAFT_798942 [Macrolepiota fuliginosa MF-IS2]